MLSDEWRPIAHGGHMLRCKPGAAEQEAGGQRRRWRCGSPARNLPARGREPTDQASSSWTAKRRGSRAIDKWTLADEPEHRRRTVRPPRVEANPAQACVRN
jgi:hypothetical protein